MSIFRPACKDYLLNGVIQTLIPTLTLLGEIKQCKILR